jgi:hypothetical protein
MCSFIRLNINHDTRLLKSEPIVQVFHRLIDHLVVVCAALDVADFHVVVPPLCRIYPHRTVVVVLDLSFGKKQQNLLHLDIMIDYHYEYMKFY